MTPPRGEVLQGTLDLIVLKTLDALGPLHGYGIAQRIQQVSEDDNNRKAKYYSLTRSGRKQLASEAKSWERMAGMIARLLGAEGA